MDRRGLHGIPGSTAAARCPFATLAGAVGTVIPIIQMGVPVSRIEIMDEGVWSPVFGRCVWDC